MGATVGFGRDSTEARFERKLSVTGPVKLDISARSGVVRVRRGDDGFVTIQGILRAHSSIFSWSHPEDHIQYLAENPPIHQNGNAIQIGDVTDRWLLRRVQFLVDITAPSDTAVRALGDSADLRVEGIRGPVDCETDSGEIQITSIGSEVNASSDSGAIHIHGVQGTVDVRTDSGEIEAFQIAGGIDAHTDSGSIRLSQSAVGPVYAQSDSGRISLKLASTGGYTIRVSTDHGRIDTPNMPESRHSGREAAGSIRGGGSVVAIETDSGDIEII
jgi:Toastrack DUF4097